jgi:uncharacterized protein (UPF0210 family)
MIARRTLVALPFAPALARGAESRPKVRAITAFIDYDPTDGVRGLRQAAAFLDQTRRAFRTGGFEVESIRVVTQPFPEYTKSLSKDAALDVLRKFEALAEEHVFDPNIGPVSVAKMELLAEVLCRTKLLNASAVVADRQGIRWDAIRQAAKLIKIVSERSERSQGNFNFAVTAMLGPLGPFYPGAYHLGGSRAFAVGLEAANVVAEVFAQYRDPREAEARLASELGRQVQDADRIASRAAAGGWTYAGIDPTPAPLKDISIGGAIEKFTGAPFGSSGTMTAAAIITRAVQSIPVKRVGYSGLMVPVLEDAVLARRWAEGTYNIDSLLAYSAVCGTGWTRSRYRALRQKRRSRVSSVMSRRSRIAGTSRSPRACCPWRENKPVTERSLTIHSW